MPFDVEAHNRIMIDINYVVQSAVLDSHYNVFGMMSAKGCIHTKSKAATKAGRVVQ